jgi:dolichol-phosphate mannosyltransferase
LAGARAKNAAHLSRCPRVQRIAGNLHKFADRVDAAIAPVSRDYEIILVDDGSSNNAWVAIAAMASNDTRIKGVRLSRNFGQHIAITAEIDHAAGEWIVVMDSDLQDRPEVVPAIYRKAREGFDIVFVDRRDRPETGLYRFNILLGLIGVYVGQMVNSGKNRPLYVIEAAQSG